MAAQLYSKCSLITCPIEISLFKYRPSLAANTTLLVLCALAAVAHLMRGIYSRHPWFTFAVVMGCTGEIIGYTGRVAGWYHPFSIDVFLVQICCITVAPAFLSAALYIVLGDVIRSTSLDTSRLGPRGYAAIFVPCDIVSLVLQGVGGGWTAVRLRAGLDTTTAGWITVAGLAFQVCTMVVFISLAVEYVVKVRRLNLRVGNSWTRRGHIFAVAFSLAITCIFIRCVYRVYELSDGGWASSHLSNQVDFIVLEGVMIVVAIYALLVGHPSTLQHSTVLHFKPDMQAESNPELSQMQW